MYTAHYDHLGIHPNEPGDNIYNGAADNATGCGILLEWRGFCGHCDVKTETEVHFCVRHSGRAGAAGFQISGSAPAERCA